MTEPKPYRFPARDWGDDEPEPVELPIVLVSSRDGADVPPVAGAIALAEVARVLGWSVKQTYALASCPEVRYLNGKLRKPAHMLHTVALRFSRAAEPRNQWGFAVWHREDDGGWRFAHAFVNGQQLGARSIAEALK